MNKLYYGDNLEVLRNNVAAESVDLLYLDPPFNSRTNYNVLFKSPGGEDSAAQIEAFEDTWHWNESAERAFDDVLKSSHSDAATMLRAMRSALGENDMMAYLAMMSARLIEMHRVLKATGTLYLHCDPTASHYLKIMLDSIFGARNYINEISWRRTTAKADYQQGALHFPRVRDIIFRYAKDASNRFTFNQPFQGYDDEYVSTKYKHKDKDGRLYRLDNLTGPGGAAKGNAYYEVMGIKRHWRYSREKMADLIEAGRVIQTKPGTVPQYKRYLDEMPGVPVSDDWDDIRPINSQAQERLGYPTQKPLILLERIISTSSKEGDLVLDPFCGCGTTIHAAEKMRRAWIGIDITHLAVSLIERRLRDAFPGIQYEVFGVPRDLAGARDLARRDKHEFQKWITAVIGAQPYRGGRKGMDRGIDGYLHFRDIEQKPQIGIVSVKGGENINPAMVRDLKGTMEREKAALGFLLTLTRPTREMVREAVSAGLLQAGERKIPRVQILSVEDIFAGAKPEIPFGHTEGFKKAERERTTSQGSLL